MPVQHPDRPRHLYIHVPFCARRCAYCDFSIAVRSTVPHAEYADALRRELDIRCAPDVPWELDTVYLGGGTPSKLGTAGIERVLDLVRADATLTPGAEVTIEANPEDVTRDAARAWRAAGVNRVSLGVQSFDDAVLSWMHRTHDAAAVPRAVDALRAAGIRNYSLDLIFALPAAVTRSWESDVARALELAPAHLSLYGLTIEPHTVLGRREARGELEESPDERYEREFLHAHDALGEAGFEHYEVSNFGRPGLHSRHNSAYWAGVPYAGLGPSAHEFDGAVRQWNVSAYADWLRRLRAGADPVAGRETLSAQNRVAEAVYLGLRTQGGLALEQGETARIEPWIDAGWARLAADGRLVLTPMGWLRLDSLAATLTMLRSR